MQSRLGFSFFLACALLIPIASGATAAQGNRDVMTSFDTVEVGPGIIAFVAPETTSQFVSGNSVAVIGDDGVLVVDSGQFPALTKKMIAELHKRTDKPVRYLVNTHWHLDHMTGNSVYKQEYPGVSIISTPSTKMNGDLYDPRFLQMEKDGYDTFVQKIKKMLETGKRANGQTLDAAAMENYRRLLSDLDEYIPLLPAMHYVGPELTFNDELDLYLGKRLVKVIFLGKGNTAGDAVVYVPDAKVLATGDLVVLPVPFATASFIDDWVHALDKLQTFEITAMVPGHGPVQKDFAYVTTLENTLKSVLNQVKSAVGQGKSLEQTQTAVNLEREKAAAVGTSTVRSANWDLFFQRPAIASAYKQVQGIPTDENPNLDGK